MVLSLTELLIKYKVYSTISRQKFANNKADNILKTADEINELDKY